MGVLCFILVMKALRSFETSVDMYKSTRRNIPEDLQVQSSTMRRTANLTNEQLRRGIEAEVEGGRVKTSWKRRKRRLSLRGEIV